jgi:hypothetical protein
VRLEPGYLDWNACAILADVIRPQDLLECSGRPFEALLSGLRSGGDAWTAIAQPDDDRDPPRLLGAFGYTRFDTIWSLWRDLSVRESLAVLRQTPQWVRTMLTQSGRPFLFNFVHTTNSPALGWLEASRCFLIDYANPVMLGDTITPAYCFQTRALEELPQRV